KGVAAAPLGCFCVLNRGLRTFVDAPKTLKTALCPHGLFLCHRNGICRAVCRAKSAAVASVCHIKRFCGARKVFKTKMNQAGFQRCKASFVHMIGSFLL